MGRFLFLAMLMALVFLGPAFAEETALAEEIGGEDTGARLAVVEGTKLYYERMLRDAKTETAAKYFLKRLAVIEQQRVVLAEEAVAKKPKPAPPPAAPVALRADKWLRSRIWKKVSEPDMSLSDVVAWTRRELSDEFMASAAEWLGGTEAVSRDAAEKAWEGRARAGWLSASYGSGTFIVVPPKVGVPPRRDRKKRSPSRDPKDIRIPRPPTRDQWWAKASSAVRTAWALAFFVENSGLFDVADGRTWTACPTCHGKGFLGRALCNRCGGAKRDAAVKYR